MSRVPNHLPQQGRCWPLTMPLMVFGVVVWALVDATAHTLVIGASGSGKTSAVLRTFALAFLKWHFGVFVLCTKPDDRAMWLRWASETGRSLDVRVFAPGCHRFDLLKYLTQHCNPAVRNRTNIVECLENMLQPVLGNTRGTASEEEFWKIQRRMLLTHLLAIAMCSGMLITFDLLWEILKSAPEDLDTASSDHAWASTEFGRCLRLAEVRTAGTPDAKEVQRAKRYFLEDYPKFPDKTRACVVMTVQGMLSCFQDPAVEDLTSALDFTPEDALLHFVLIVDLPNTVVGRMLALGLKDLLQKAAMRRSVGPDDVSTVPAFFCIDEFQEWITPEDASFLAKARASRVCCLCLTQNLPGMIAAVGGATPQQSVDAMCGNFSTKVFLAATDPSTTDWMSAMVGKSLQFSVSAHSSSDFKLFSRPSFSVSQQREPDLYPDDFQRLRTGGPHNGFEVDAIVLLGAKAVQAIGRPWERVVFAQRESDSGKQEPVSAWWSVRWVRRCIGWF